MRKIIIATGAALAVLAAPVQALAAPSQTLGVEMGNGTVVTRTVNVNTAADRETALNYLKKVRADMWDRNMPLDGKGLQQLEPDKAAYVNRLQWSGDLERIAYQRAFEQYDARGLSHTRPDGSSSWTATVDGRQSWGENLCGDSTLTGCLRALTYGEERGLRAAKGDFSGGGHLYNVLNPASDYVGAAFIGKWGSTQHSSFPSSTAPLDIKGTTEFSAATPDPGGFTFRNQGGTPKPGEQPGEQPGDKPGDTTKPGDGNYTPNVPDLSSLSSNTEAGKIIGIIFGVISILIPIGAWLMNSGLLPF